jgi:hypothetical protein
MDITPRQTTAIITFVVLIVLYCMPVLLLGWWLYSTNFQTLEYDKPIPQMVVTFNSGGGTDGAAAAPDLLGMLHRVLLPVATLISGLLAVSLSRSKLNYVVIGLLLSLIILVFATYVGLGTSVGGAPSKEDENLVSYIAISSVLSRTFDMLFSFVLLFLGIAVGVSERPNGGEDRSSFAEPARPSSLTTPETRKSDEAGSRG